MGLVNQMIQVQIPATSTAEILRSILIGLDGSLRGEINVRLALSLDVPKAPQGTTGVVPPRTMGGG